MRDNSIHLALASDDCFRIGVLATLRSISKHLSPSRQLDVNILDCGLSDKSELVETLRRNTGVNAQIRVRPVPLEQLSQFGLNRPRLSKAAFARLLAPSLLPDLNRVLYLDSDLLVTGDLAALWDIDLKGKAIGAVADPYFVLLGADVSNCRQLGVSPYHRYFGSGVLLIDLKQWRDRGIERQLIRIGETNQLKRRFNDQSILNFHFGGHVHFLPRCWNQLRCHWNGSASFTPFQRGIVHVGGSPKPWHFPAKGAVGVNRLYRDIMWGAEVPASWLPAETRYNAPRTPRSVFQTTKAVLRAGPLGYVPSLPYVVRWMLDSLRMGRRNGAREQARLAGS